MAKVRPFRKEQPYYLIPIMMGMAGLLFSRQLEDPWLQGTVVLMCVAVPLFLAGNVLGRIRRGGTQSYLLLAGMTMLTLGAVVAVSGYSESLVASETVSKQVGEFSQILGMASLLLGLLIVIYFTVYSQALIIELGERFTHVADHMGEGLILSDADGIIVFVNKTFTRMTGIPQSEMLGRIAAEVARELGAETMAEHTEKREYGIASQYEMSWNVDGEERYFWVSGAPIYDHRGQRVGVISTTQDITEIQRLSKQLEDYADGLQRLVDSQTEKLAGSEARLRNLLKNMDEGFLTLDDGHTIRYANDRIRRMLKIGAEALVGRHISDFLDAENCDRLTAATDSILNDSAARVDQEYTLTRSDRAAIPAKVSIALIEDGSNEEGRYSLVVTDIQELKDMHYQLELRARQLEQANEELRQLDLAKDAFLSNVSHELRTPLSTIRGYVEMWEQGSLGEVMGPQSGALKVMARNVERLSSMIHEMIEFSRMEIRGVRLHKTLFSPAKLFGDCVSSVHPEVLNKDLSINSFVADDLHYMWGDREKLVQVIRIFLSNSVKFSHQGSMIQLHAFRGKNNEVMLQIADTGIGIDPAYQERIFAKFYQVDSSMTRHYQGTGIGLSIAKSIVEAHGGAIELESKLEKGSTFTLRLPDTLFETVRDDTPHVNLAGWHAMVANPLSEFRAAVLECLIHWQCEVTEFTKGFDCVRAASDEQPDFILIDEAMPDISGFDLVRYLHDDMSTADISVVLFRGSADGVSPSEEDFFETLYVLEKPFSAAQLAKRLEEIVQTREPREPTFPEGS